jgi:hypothetical protein
MEQCNIFRCSAIDHSSSMGSSRALRSQAVELARALRDQLHCITTHSARSAIPDDRSTCGGPAGRQLVAILGTLSKRMQRCGKPAVVKSMTTSAPSAQAM